MTAILSILSALSIIILLSVRAEKPKNPLIRLKNELINNESKNSKVLREIINGKWGTGNDRKDRLIKAGYDYNELQEQANNIIKILEEYKNSYTYAVYELKKAYYELGVSIKDAFKKH